MSSDIAVAVSNRNLNVNSTSLKPMYLVYLNEGKSKTYFIAQEKPVMESSFVLAKGIFCKESEENILSNFYDLFSLEKKENVVEIYFPWHRVYQIKNLVFKTNMKK